MVKPNASGMGSTARFRGILQKAKWTGRSSGRFWSSKAFLGKRDQGFVEHLREMGAKTAQNFGTHGKFRLEKLQNRPEVRGCVKCALG